VATHHNFAADLYNERHRRGRVKCGTTNRGPLGAKRAHRLPAWTAPFRCARADLTMARKFDTTAFLLPLQSTVYTNLPLGCTPHCFVELSPQYLRNTTIILHPRELDQNLSASERGKGGDRRSWRARGKTREGPPDRVDCEGSSVNHPQSRVRRRPARSHHARESRVARRRGPCLSGGPSTPQTTPHLRTSAWPGRGKRLASHAFWWRASVSSFDFLLLKS